jgi:PKD repeat protein
MSLKQFLFEAGPSGASVGTSGSNTIGATTVSVGTGSITYDTTMKASVSGGAYGLKFTYSAASGTCLVRLAPNAGNTTMAFSGVYTTPSTQPGAAADNIVFATLRNSGGAVFKMIYSNARQIKLGDAGSLSPTMTPTLTGATKYRFEVILIAGTGSTDSITVKIYPDTSGAAVLDTYTTSAANLGTTAIVSGDFGVIGGSGHPAEANTSGWDNIQFNDGSSVEIGPYTPPAGPAAVFAVTYGPLSVAVDAASSTGTGTLTYAWSFGDGGTATGRTASHTYAAAGTYTVQLTVTDGSGQNASSTTSVTVKAPSKVAKLNSIVKSTGWQDQSGATTTSALLTALTDGLGTTWAETSASNQTIGGMLDPLLTPASGSTVKVSVAGDRLSSATGTVVAKLYEAGVLRATSDVVACPTGTSGQPVAGAIDATTGAVSGGAFQLTFAAVDQATVTAWAAGNLELDIVDVLS